MSRRLRRSSVEMGNCKMNLVYDNSIEQNLFQNSSGKKKAIQVGLISRGQKCARINRPGIYTKLSAFKDWIVKNTKDGGCSGFK
jgi:hypothetical protein